jgi:dTDP-4-dehydrorhamnose 3,5-epimerase
MGNGFGFTETAIEGLFVISPFHTEDLRGAFTKDYSKEVFEQNGIAHDLVEVFYTRSHQGVIRALHFQRVKQQAKLVRCVYGKIFDVVVDLRTKSSTFKTWLSFTLSGINQQEILVPAGCAHGYLVLEESVVSYKCAEKFYGDYDDGILWHDKDLGIEWPLHLIGGKDRVILSEKDLHLPTFSQFMKEHGGF